MVEFQVQPFYNHFNRKQAFVFMIWDFPFSFSTQRPEVGFEDWVRASARCSGMKPRPDTLIKAASANW